MPIEPLRGAFSRGARVLTGLALATLLGCTPDPPPPAAAPAAPSRPAPDSSRAGSVHGVVLTTAADDDVPLAMDADPVCTTLQAGAVDSGRIERDAEGHLANVFVWVERGLEEYGFQPPREEVRIRQEACAYRPRVVGVQVGQTLAIVNEDPTLHNVHARATANRSFNEGQPFRGMELRRRFEHAEVPVALRCDVHPWMTAFVGVVDHPYFAVTGADGSFTLGPLPPGTYGLAAWHERLGIARQRVDIVEAATAEVRFDLSPPG